MTNFYELADNDRGKLIFTKDQLLAPIQSGMLPPPFPMADGLEERDYYLGKVTTSTDDQRHYVETRDAASDDDLGYAEGPGNPGAAVPGEHDLVHAADPTAAQTREGANP